jgi:hypothetical protein
MRNTVLNNVKPGTERSRVISLKLRPLRRREKALGIHCVEGWIGRRESLEIAGLKNFRMSGYETRILAGPPVILIQNRPSQHYEELTLNKWVYARS